MASTGQAQENHSGAVLECSTPRKLDGRCPLGLLLQLLRSLCPIVANGRRLEERGVQNLVKNRPIFRTSLKTRRPEPPYARKAWWAHRTDNARS